MSDWGGAINTMNLNGWERIGREPRTLGGGRRYPLVGLFRHTVSLCGQVLSDPRDERLSATTATTTSAHLGYGTESRISRSHGQTRFHLLSGGFGVSIDRLRESGSAMTSCWRSTSRHTPCMWARSALSMSRDSEAAGVGGGRTGALEHACHLEPAPQLLPCRERSCDPHAV